MGAYLPRPVKPPTLEGSFAGLSRRVRRLEVNHKYPAAGTASYAETYTLSPATSWTPDFSEAAAEIADQVGFIPDSSGVEVPTGWIAWVVVEFSFSATNPPMGESIFWTVGGTGGSASERCDVMRNGTQSLTTTVVAPSGWNGDELLVGLFAESTFGTEFTPLTMAISAVAIQLPVNGISSGPT